VEGFRLSPQQRHLWAQGDGPAYRTCCTIVIAGDLDRDRLRQAVAEVVARHESLRTCLQRWPGRKLPLQIVRESLPAAWEEITEVRELAQARVDTPLDLAKGPLAHLTLIRLDAGRHLLQMVLPALAADAASLGILFREVVDAYRAGAGRGPAAEEVVQFLQVAEWQNELAEDEDSEMGRELWRQDLAGASPVSLPYERRAGGGEPFLPAIELSSYEPAAAAALAECASRLDSTLDRLLLAAWSCLLWRLTGKGDLCIEKVFAGRSHEDLGAVCGLVARVLPVRIRLEGGFRFHEVLRRLQAQEESVTQWQAYFSRQEAQETLGFGPEEAFSFELVEWPSAARAAGLSFALREIYTCSDRFKAKLVCGRSDGGLSVELHYDPARLDSTAARCLLGQLRELLADATADPSTPLSELRLCSPEERQRWLVDFNPPQALAIPDLCVYELFARQVSAQPDALAVVCEDRQLTYREVEARANRLAWRLKRLGVGLEAPVALCVERSVEMVVGLLGVLKAGGFYVPLDPTSPRQRLETIVEEAGASVLLTQKALLGCSPGNVERIEILDEDAGGPEPAAWTGGRATPAQLAYVLFTSGSTGRPKGVAVEHRQLVSYLQAVAERLALPADASFATVSTFAADLGNTAIFPALCLGGCLHVIAQDRVADAEAFAGYFATHAVDCLKIVPSHLASLLSGPGSERALPRRLLVLGGEAASWDLIDRVRALNPACQIMNHYGPTETTVGVLGARLDPESAVRGTRPPLGKPFANSRVYLLDHDLEIVSAGIPGEVYIGGAGLARGYLGRPDLTAERFLPSPFGGERGGRLYRTGDLARYLPWGDLEFLGRADQQVKIRGFRVELAEIESLLRQHPAVQEAAVLLREDRPEEKRLAAYVVLRRGPGSSTQELRDFLRAKLPEHMLPAAFVKLAALPLTPNGKLDRQALPQPEVAARESEARFEPVSSPVEEMVAGYWEQLLGLSRVGRGDHFFDLGGHSLLATQLVSRLRETFQVDLPLRQLFETPTVAGLAGSIEALLGAGRTTTVPPIERAPRQDGRGIPLSFGQRRLWLSQQFDPSSSAYNIPSSIRVTGPLSIPVLERSVSELVRRHEILRTRFREEEEGEPLQLVGPAVPVAVPVTDLSALPEKVGAAESTRLAAAAARAPFDLATGPLLRVAVLRLAAESHAVLFAVHHIVSDAWSAAVLVREVVSLYSALARGESSPLPDLPIQYADFAVWQRQWLRPEKLSAEVDFWQRQLAGELPVLDLADRPRPPVMTHRGANRSAVLADDLLAGVRALSRSQGTTSFMTLLAAFEVVLSHQSGATDVLVGTNVLGRNQTRTEGLIGFFLNMVVLRTDLSGNPTFAQLLARVRDTAIQAYAHQDLPFDQLVEILKPRRDPSRHPLFQVKVDYQKLPRQEGAPAGLGLERMDFDFATSHCDLTLYLKDFETSLLVTLERNVDLFGESAVLRLLSHLETVLQRVVADPGVALADLCAELREQDESDRRTQEEGFKEARLQELRAATRRRSGIVLSSTEVGP
jgi:amino acid adenylation domain-containing protein